MLGGWGEDMMLMAASVVRGGCCWSMIRSRVILAWGVEGRGAVPGQGQGRSFSFLHLFSGGQVVAEDSRVILYRS